MSKGGGGITIPKDYTLSIGGLSTAISADYGLDDIHIKEIPPVSFGVTQFPEVTANSNISIKEIPPLVSTVTTVSTVSTDSRIAITEIPPITSNVNVAITQIPEQRVHLPTHYQIGFALFGVELWSLSLCGETQVINEKYVPRGTERCS